MTGSTLEDIRSVDLDLLRPAQRELSAVVALSVAQGVVVVAQAFAITGLVVALVDGDPLARWAWAVAGVFALRAIVSWGVDVAAARSAAVVGTSLRGRLLARAVRLDARWWADTQRWIDRGARDPWRRRDRALSDALPARHLDRDDAADPHRLGDGLAGSDQRGDRDLHVAARTVFAALVGWNTQQRAQRQWREMSTLAGHFVDVVKGLPTLGGLSSRRCADRAASAR